MNQTSLIATYTSHSQTEDQAPQKQVNLFAPVEASLPTPTSDPNADTKGNTFANTDVDLKHYTESKQQYFSSLRSAASKVQEDINALLTAEMQADKIRDMAGGSSGSVKDITKSDGRPETKQIQREPQGKAKESRVGELPDDDDDDGLEDESDENM